MIDKVLSTIKKYDMISPGDRVLLAVSGGADSVVMLMLLYELKDRLGITLQVAHIEHGIRGEESVSDSEFVRSLCNRYNIEFSMLSINAVDEAKKFGMSVEEYSRKRRYEFFETLNADKIATAHNADDNAETLLFRLARGTGLKGACGIPPVRGNIIRPLIEISSAQIRNYAQVNGIEYRVDSTNAHNDYSRNYIRNVIIPSLKELNTSAVEQINNFIYDANEDNAFLDFLANKAYYEALDNEKLVIGKLKLYDKAIIKRVILNYLSAMDISVDRVHLNSIMCLLDKTGKIQITGNIFVVSYNDRLYVHKYYTNDKMPSVNYGTASIDEIVFSDVDFYCDYDKINGNVSFRKRLDGDKISPAGRGCTKSFKKLFNELKIPEYERDKLIVICDDTGVIGVLGYAVDERVKADKNTKTVFYCEIPMED